MVNAHGKGKWRLPLGFGHSELRAKLLALLGGDVGSGYTSETGRLPWTETTTYGLSNGHESSVDHLEVRHHRCKPLQICPAPPFCSKSDSTLSQSNSRTISKVLSMAEGHRGRLQDVDEHGRWQQFVRFPGDTGASSFMPLAPPPLALLFPSFQLLPIYFHPSSTHMARFGARCSRKIEIQSNLDAHFCSSIFLV